VIVIMIVHSFLCSTRSVGAFGCVLICGMLVQVPDVQHVGPDARVEQLAGDGGASVMMMMMMIMMMMMMITTIHSPVATGHACKYGGVPRLAVADVQLLLRPRRPPQPLRPVSPCQFVSPRAVTLSACVTPCHLAFNPSRSVVTYKPYRPVGPPQPLRCHHRQRRASPVSVASFHVI
jgi:hypothetical protein